MSLLLVLQGASAATAVDFPVDDDYVFTPAADDTFYKPKRDILFYTPAADDLFYEATD